MDIKLLRHRLDVMSCLDEIMTPENKAWLRMFTKGEVNNYKWYLMDNGAGDVFKVIFHDIGVVLKGFDHENELNQFAADEWDYTFFENMFRGIPKELYDLFTEQERDKTTFCMWYLNATGKWYENAYDGNDGGKSFLLRYIRGNVEDFIEWASDYYEEDFNRDVMEKLFNDAILTDEEKDNLIIRN